MTTKHQPRPVTAPPAILMGRLIAAGGHTNAAERHLLRRHDGRDRGLWSADQAKARLAEAWMWLLDKRTVLLPMGQHVPRDAARECIDTFARAPKTRTVEAAWENLITAENALRNENSADLDTLPSGGPRNHDAFCRSLDRRYSVVRELRWLAKAVERHASGRFLDLRCGEWVRVCGHGTGRVHRLEGFTVELFVPEDFAPFVPTFLEGGHSFPPLVGYSIGRFRMERIAAPEDPAGVATPPGGLPDHSAASGDVSVSIEYVKERGFTLRLDVASVSATCWSFDDIELTSLLDWLDALWLGEVAATVELDIEEVVLTVHAFDPGMLLTVSGLDKRPDAVVVDEVSFFNAFRSALTSYLKRPGTLGVDFRDHPFLVRDSRR